MEDSRLLQRNYNFDALKIVAAFMVCFQHACGTGLISAELLALSRIAVPEFMLITGFLYLDICNRNNQKVQIKKYIKIAWVMFLIYFLYEIGLHFFRNDIWTYLRDKFSIASISNFLLLNKPIAADHSWYMWAMIYTFLICLIIPSVVNKKRITIICITATLALQLIFGKYALLLFGKEFPSFLTRNVWTIGLPYFLIGVEIRRSKLINQSCKTFCLLTIIFALLCLAEQKVLIHAGVNAARDSYIFTAPLAIGFFMIFATMKKLKQKNTLVQWGIKYSLPFYIIHPLLVKIEVRVFRMNTIWQYIGVLFVLVTSLLLTMLYYNFNQRIIRRC